MLYPEMHILYSNTQGHNRKNTFCTETLIQSNVHTVQFTLYSRPVRTFFVFVIL